MGTGSICHGYWASTDESDSTVNQHCCQLSGSPWHYTRHHPIQQDCHHFPEYNGCSHYCLIRDLISSQHSAGGSPIQQPHLL